VGAVRNGIEQKARQYADKNYCLNNWGLIRLQRSGGGWADSTSVRFESQLFEVTYNYSISEMILFWFCKIYKIYD
jgi:hypothetical protein